MAANADDADFVQRTLAHYADKFAQHGSTPQGVDWNGAASQRLQFEQLLRLLPPPGAAFSVNDFGCGYGALADLLHELHPQASLWGNDINAEMVAAAHQRHGANPQMRFDVASRPLQVADWGIASGVFTLRLGRSDAACWQAMADGLDALDATSRHGFAFNCLTSWSDADKMKEHLYYPDPAAVFNHCKRAHARNVALLHDYGLYAFTILVRKTVAPGA